MVKHRKIGVVRNPNGRFQKKSRPKKSAARRAGSARRAKPARAKKKHSPRSKPNPALMSLGFMNPSGGGMATKRKKSRKRPATHSHRKAARSASNPHRRGGGGRRRGSKRNPNYVGGGIRLLKSGLFALIGFVATKQAAQIALGARNTGPLGYLANGVAAFLLSAVASKLPFFGRDGAEQILIGGGVYTVNRIIQDQFSAVGKYLSVSGLGDPMTLTGIGPGYFPLPVPTDAAGMPIIPAEIRALPPAAVNAAAAAVQNAGLGTARTRFVSRFAS